MSNNLLDKVVNIQPVGVVYNLSGSDLKEFVLNYLNKMGISGIASVGTNMLRAGSSRPEIGLYVILETSSVDVTSNMRNIPSHIRKKMEGGGYRPSEKLKQALIPICKDIRLVTKDRYVIIKCDVFKVLALMFKADPRVHTLSIPEVAKIKGDCIFTLIKGSKFVGEPEKGGDKFARLISEME